VRLSSTHYHICFPIVSLPFSLCFLFSCGLVSSCGAEKGTDIQAMQSPGETLDKGEKELGVVGTKDLSNSPGSVSSLEAAHDEDPKAKGLTRKLLIKLDTRYRLTQLS